MPIVIPVNRESRDGVMWLLVVRRQAGLQPTDLLDRKKLMVHRRFIVPIVTAATLCLSVFGSDVLAADQKPGVSLVADGPLGPGARHGLGKVKAAPEVKASEAPKEEIKETPKEKAPKTKPKTKPSKKKK